MWSRHHSPQSRYLCCHCPAKRSVVCRLAVTTAHESILTPSAQQARHPLQQFTGILFSEAPFAGVDGPERGVPGAIGFEHQADMLGHLAHIRTEKDLQRVTVLLGQRHVLNQKFVLLRILLQQHATVLHTEVRLQLMAQLSPDAINGKWNTYHPFIAKLLKPQTILAGDLLCRQRSGTRRGATCAEVLLQRIETGCHRTAAHFAAHFAIAGPQALAHTQLALGRLQHSTAVIAGLHLQAMRAGKLLQLRPYHPGITANYQPAVVTNLAPLNKVAFYGTA